MIQDREVVALEISPSWPCRRCIQLRVVVLKTHAVSVCWVGVVAATDRETSTICSSERVMCALTKVFFKLGCLRAMNLGEI